MNNPFQKTKIIINYQSKDIINLFTKIISQNEPFFFGRIGGSDFDIVQEYFNNKNLYNKISIYDFIPTPFLRIYDKFFLKNTLKRKYSYAIKKVKRFNGYFDFQNNRSNFIKYLEEILYCYKNANYFFYAGSTLIKKFENNNFNENDLNFLNYILENKTIIDYSFIESVLPFLESFKIWGENKKILIISPFSKSLEYQYKRKDNLIKNYNFPNFKLITYNTKITYSTKNDTKETLGVNTNNWNEEIARIKKDVEKIDFDIALLSCGSYSMGLGCHIKNIGKKAIYLGGVLNVIFDVYGKRYDTTFFNNIVNCNYQITSIENEEINKIKGGRKVKNESLDAYFGIKR